MVIAFIVFLFIALIAGFTALEEDGDDAGGCLVFILSGLVALTLGLILFFSDDDSDKEGNNDTKIVTKEIPPSPKPARIVIFDTIRITVTDTIVEKPIHLIDTVRYTIVDTVVYTKYDTILVKKSENTWYDTVRIH